MYRARFLFLFFLRKKLSTLFAATGEPALCMSYAVPIALRYALDSARKDAGSDDLWYNLGELCVFVIRKMKFVCVLVMICLQMVQSPLKRSCSPV